MKKEKKEKVIYYDDGRTIADMSCLNNSKPKMVNLPQANNKYHATEKEKLQTFFQAFKMMLIPTAVVLGILAVLFLFFYFLTN